jgi:type III secretion protein J
VPPTRRLPRLRLPLLLLLLPLGAGCGREELLHGLDERQANDVLVALDEGGLAASTRRAEGTGDGWVVEVPGADASRARRLLSERELPRPRTPGFGDVFGEPGMVPTPVEEHARYLHALSGELARTLEALDGVVEARVHLGLPPEDPLRPGAPPTPRAAVLLRCRPAACGSVRSLEAGLRSLVAGSADGLSPDAVSVLVVEASAPSGAPRPARGGGAWRLAAAGALALLAGLLGWVGLGRPRPPFLRRHPSR